MALHGKHVWYELTTNDVTGAAAFYSTVMGWDARASKVPDLPGTILTAGRQRVVGLRSLVQAAGGADALPGWRGYVAVDDVDATAQHIASNGGTVAVPPFDIPGVGRSAEVRDPQGAAFMLIRPAEPDAEPAQSGLQQGRVAWHELHTTDQDAAFAFYAGTFGWTKAHSYDMGPTGLYQLFATGDEPRGGMMTVPGRTSWLYYVRVDDIQAAAKRVTDAGGRIVRGPQEVPGPDWILQGLDPQGVSFAMVAPC